MTRTRQTLLFVATLSLVSSPDLNARKTDDRGSKVVAVLELVRLGIDDSVARALHGFLANKIATMKGFRVIPALDLQITLQDPKNQKVAACGGGADCALKVGRLVGADLVVFGSLSSMGEATAFRMRALDVAGGKEIAQQTGSFSGDKNQLIPELQLAVYQLLDPSGIRGWLELDVDVAGVEVFVGDEAVGKTPLPQIQLKPGTHKLKLKRAGFPDWVKDVSVTAFEPTVVEVRFQGLFSNERPASAWPADR